MTYREHIENNLRMGKRAVREAIRAGWTKEWALDTIYKLHRLQDLNIKFDDFKTYCK